MSLQVIEIYYLSSHNQTNLIESVYSFLFFFKAFNIQIGKIKVERFAQLDCLVKSVVFCFSRHEKPTDPDDPLADQNIKDRYYGINDPVADKLLKRASAMPRLDPPEDKTITTLYIGGLGDNVTDGDLK